MTKQDVIEKILYLKKYESENERLEVKSAKGGFPKKCYDTISSFSNKRGGIIIFGINEENDFEVEGVYDVNDIQKQITDLCSDSMYPIIRPEIISFKYEDKDIMAVKINELPMSEKPCYYKPKGIVKGSYTRVGDRDDILTDYELYSLQCYSENIFNDTRIVKKSGIDDLDMEKITNYINTIKSIRPNFAKNSFEKCMELCGIVSEEEGKLYPTIAGMMIFGLYPQAFLHQLFVACTAIPGITFGDVGNYGERFIDSKRIEGTIEEMFNGTMNFLIRNMRNCAIINKTGTRINKPEYPLNALREAIINALIHRDYSYKTEGCYISVNLYNDRIEIISPGNLYGLNENELDLSLNMQSRNPTIVKILENENSLVENRYSGIPVMKREMKEYGFPAPEFYNGRENFKVVFKNNNDSQTIYNNKDEYIKDIAKVREEVVDYCITPRSAKEIRRHFNIHSRNYISTNIIRPLIESKKLTFTNTENLNDKNQKYKTINKSML